MKKWMAVFTFALFAGLTCYVSTGNAQTGQGGYGPGQGYGSGYCPWYAQCPGPYGGGYGMGPGMMGGYGYGYGMGPGMMNRGYGRGYGMGPGMMGPGYGHGYGMGPGMMGPGYGYGYGPQSGRQQYGPQSQQPQKPLEENEAKQEVQDYIQSTNNPNLKIGEVQEKGNDYEVSIVTKDGSLVDKVLVNKDTGWMRPAY